MRFHGAGPLLGVQGAGKVMEVFRIRNEAQAKKKMKRCVCVCDNRGKGEREGGGGRGGTWREADSNFLVA